MPYETSYDAHVKEVLNSNETYYHMMVEWHASHDGLAVEPDVKRLIEDACRPGRQVLEAGSGPGCITNWFATRHPETRFVGVDISHIAVDLARAASPQNAEFHLADLKRLPFRDQSFDFIFSQSVLEHIVGWEDALGELYRVLQPGGRFLIRVENGGVKDTRSRAYALLNYLFLRNRVAVEQPSFRLDPGDWTQHETNFDVQEIPSDVLLSTLRRHGYTISWFTTGTKSWRGCGNWKAELVSYLQFWPFSHLGSTTIVLAEKHPLGTLLDSHALLYP